MTRRTMGWIGAAVAVGAAATVAGLAISSAHPPGDRPKRIWVGNAGLFVRASGGSFCWPQSGGAHRCVDLVQPIEVRGRLPVDARDRVRLLIPDHARRVTVSLLRARKGRIENIDWRARARRVSKNPHRWRFRLPADLGGANRLEVFVRYPKGDRYFSAGLRPSA